MNRSTPPTLLDRITTGLLLLVAVFIGWIICVAHWPTWFRLASLEWEVLAVVGLLSVAVLLVSLVSLLHTRH